MEALPSTGRTFSLGLTLGYDKGMDDNPYRAPLFDEGCLAQIVGKRSACYRSTPEHLRSFVTIALGSISTIRTGQYSRWAKPIRLNYIEVRYRDGGIETTALLTPTRSWMASVWETNRIVADWVQSLEAACDMYGNPEQSSGPVPAS